MQPKIVLIFFENFKARFGTSTTLKKDNEEKKVEENKILKYI